MKKIIIPLIGLTLMSACSHRTKTVYEGTYRDDVPPVLRDGTFKEKYIVKQPRERGPRDERDSPCKKDYGCDKSRKYGGDYDEGKMKISRELDANEDGMIYYKERVKYKGREEDKDIIRYNLEQTRKPATKR